MIYYYVKWNITEPWDGVNDMKEHFKKKTEGESGGGAASLGGSTWYGVDKLLFVRLGAAVVLLCLGLFLRLGEGISLLLLLLSTLISGFDVLYRACVRLVKEHCLGEELIVSIAAILAFTINEGYEAAAVMLILGIFCLVYTSTLQSILTVLFGIFIFVDSMTSLTDSILCAKAKIKGWWVLFVLSILTACLGVCVVFSNFDTVIIFAGCSLIIEGLRRLVTTLVFSHKIKQAKKQLTQTQNDNPDEIVIE